MIKKAILEGELSEVRFQSYIKLQREALAVERKKSPELMIAEKKKWKKLGHMAEKIRDIKEHGR